jgi:hypothetical protein
MAALNRPGKRKPDKKAIGTPEVRANHEIEPSGIVNGTKSAQTGVTVLNTSGPSHQRGYPRKSLAACRSLGRPSHVLDAPLKAGQNLGHTHIRHSKTTPCGTCIDLW